MGAMTQLSTAAPEHYILRQASCRASHLVSNAGFRTDDWDDLRQDMALDCLQRTPQFNPDRGDWRGFVRGVVRNRSAVLITRRIHRTRREGSVLLDLDRSDTDGDPVEPPSVDPTGSMDLRLEIDRVLETLPPDLRSLAVQLEVMSVSEIAEKWSKSKTWIYVLLHRLRKALREAGITPTSPAHYRGAQ